MTDNRRMRAYYYGFDATGCPTIDKILGAVACAGKAYHHTEDWGDETTPYDDHTGECPIDWIQNAANEAVATIARLREERDRLRRALEYYAADNLYKEPTPVLWDAGAVARAALEDSNG